VRQRWSRLDDAREPRPLWLCVETVRSPGNLGSLLRTCAAAGASGLCATSQAIELHDPSVVRATMGALFRQRLVRASPEEVRRWADRNGARVVGASPEGRVDYRRLSYRAPTVLVLGGERKGLSDEQRAICDDLVHIPMQPGCDSLNLAVAGSLLVYEAWGQRHPVRR
jgi:TrmH family RNA methyltransferase